MSGDFETWLTALSLDPNSVGDHLSEIVIEIVAERLRQIADEGYSPEHDDKHDRAELSLAAAAHAVQAAGGVRLTCGGLSIDAVSLWPWGRGNLKAKPARRHLIIAAALIFAEIERLDRDVVAPARS